MDFIYLHQFSPLQAPVLSTRCSSPQQLLCAGPKALPGQSVGSHSLVWAKPTARTVPIMEQSRALWDRDGHVPWHCLVWEHPGSFRAPPGCQHIPGVHFWLVPEPFLWWIQSQCQRTERSMESLQSNISRVWRAATHCRTAPGFCIKSSVKWPGGLSKSAICLV